MRDLIYRVTFFKWYPAGCISRGCGTITDSIWGKGPGRMSERAGGQTSFRTPGAFSADAEP